VESGKVPSAKGKVWIDGLTQGHKNDNQKQRIKNPAKFRGILIESDLLGFQNLVGLVADIHG